MRRFAFVAAIIGMFFLFLFFEAKPTEIRGIEDLNKLEVNKKVLIFGEIVEARVIYGRTRIFILDNGIEILCECYGFSEGDLIEVEGVVSEFEGKKQVEVLSIAGVG
ncbi:hypothetical protein HY450_00825 [Candidatus Pacearchaeota archaeon]|nr:hypothetical protein [Candidatus Pacearchaeota archaeon]